jgi:amino acid adenylation domain-containing protein
MEINKQTEKNENNASDLKNFIQMSLLLPSKDYKEIQNILKSYVKKESLYVAALHVLLFKFDWGFKSKICLLCNQETNNAENPEQKPMFLENLQYNSEWSNQYQISLIDSILKANSKDINTQKSVSSDIRAGIIVESEKRLNEKSWIPYRLDMVIDIIQEDEGVKLYFYFSKTVFGVKVADSFAKGYRFIIHQMIMAPNNPLKGIEIVPNKTRYHILNDFCRGNRTYTDNESIEPIFKRCVEQYSEKIAVSECIDLNVVEKQFFEKLPNNQFNNYCFKQNKYLIIRQLHDDGCFILKTKSNHTLLVNRCVIDLINLFSGELSLGEIHQLMNGDVYFVIAEIHLEKPKLIQSCWDEEIYEKEAVGFNDFISIIKILMQNSIIELSSIKSFQVNNKVQNLKKITPGINGAEVVRRMKNLKTRNDSDILLLGDKPGSCSVGVLYLASYLERHGIKVSCQLYDDNWTVELLTNNIVTLLSEIRPKFVGISMKWFPHVARCLEMCKMIKDFNPSIEIILGGDTASLFCDEIIKNSNVDFIINGEGEYPLLAICRGDEMPPNCTWKKDGKVYKTPITYHRNEDNEGEIYLEDLKNCTTSDISMYFAPFYIHTHKICAMNCFYCGGRREITEKTFKSCYNKWRNPEIVRNDILLIKDKAPIIMFEFGYEPNQVMAYCKKIWEDIDLSDNYASIYCLSLPDKDFLSLVSNTFKYIRWNLDICSLSERHREKLRSQFCVKPLPNNKDILQFLDMVSQFDNIEIEINLIANLPLYSFEDAKESEEFLAYILQKYNNFCELTWGKYYTEPGTMASDKYKSINMVSGKNDFERFLYLSYKNYNTKPNYPVLSDYNFPYIFYEDTNKNIFMSEHFKKMNEIYNVWRLSKERIVECNSLTYVQLDKYSSILASNILSKYSGISLLVIMAKDKIKLTTAIMAAIKCGIPYMAIDSEYPAQRIQYISEIVKNALFLTDEFNEKISEVFTKEVSIDSLMSVEVKLSQFETAADSSLYFMLTSGSTGVPKGVYIKQKGIINYIKWRNKRYNFNQDDIHLQLLSESFDGFYSNFYSSILSGGKLVFLKSGHRKDMKLASDVIYKFGITVMSLVPSIYERLMDFSCKQKFANMRLIILGGEKITSEIIENTRNLAENIILVNEYGMTENSITSSALVGIVDSNINNIGYPIDNNSMYILNEDSNIMPAGVPGEICVSGIGLTEGYEKRHDLNEFKFIDNPYCKGERLYKTGDLGLLQPDGAFCYLERKDTQLNIHGYRLEPGEVEYYILQNDKITNANVVQKGNELVAHIAVSAEVRITALKDELRKKIPEYMIPSRFYILDELVSEKEELYFSDKKERDTTIYKSRELRQEIVYSITEFWKEALGAEEIDCNAHFFDIGGDSMSLLKIYAQLEKRYPGLLTLPDLFSHTTVNELADYLSKEIKNK